MLRVVLPVSPFDFIQPLFYLSRLLSQKNLKPLDVIFEHEPESIRETAELVNRDYKQEIGRASCRERVLRLV